MRRSRDEMDEEQRIVTAQALSMAIHAGILTLLAVLTVTGVIGDLFRKPPEALECRFVPMEEAPLVPEPPKEAPAPPIPQAPPEPGGPEEPRTEDPPPLSPLTLPDFRVPDTEDKSAEGGQDPLDLPGDPIATVEHSPFQVRAASFEGRGRDLKRMSKLTYECSGTVQEMETIRKAHREIHLVRYIPTRRDALVIDSYSPPRWHIVENPGDDFFRGYPLMAKTYTLHHGEEAAEAAKKMIGEAGMDPAAFEEVHILLPRSVWDRLLAVVEAALARKGLPRLEDEAVVQVKTRYVKEGEGYGFRAFSAIIRREGGAMVEQRLN